MNFWTEKRILVTGGAGMIGSHLVEELIEQGAEVTVADNLKRGKIDNLKKVRDKIIFLERDLSERAACEEVCTQKDVVFHLASDAYGLSYSYYHHGEILTNNILLNTNVLNACYQMDVKRILVVSSSCVYSDDANVPTEESEGFTGDPERANFGYGWSKRILEIQARQLHEDHGINIAIVRPSNVYGPRDPIIGKGTHVIPSLIHKVLFEEGPVVVWGSGNQTRNFIHVKDTVNAILLTGEKFATSTPINIGSKVSTSIRDLIHTIVAITGSSKEIVFDATKPEGAKYKNVTVNLLKEVIGFESQINIEDGLRDTIDFYRSELAGLPRGYVLGK